MCYSSINVDSWNIYIKETKRYFQFSCFQPFSGRIYKTTKQDFHQEYYSHSYLSMIDYMYVYILSWIFMLLMIHNFFSTTIFLMKSSCFIVLTICFLSTGWRVKRGLDSRLFGTLGSNSQACRETTRYTWWLKTSQSLQSSVLYKCMQYYLMIIGRGEGWGVNIYLI